VIHDFTDMAAYMDVRALRRMMREGDTVSGAFLQVDGQEIEKLYRTLKGMPKVASVTVKMAALRSFETTLAENMLRMRTFNIIFACVIAFGVVYNCARISLAERSRDLATLRVLGFTRGEISAILLGELAVLTLAALVPGMLLGRVFAAMLTVALETDTQRFPLAVYPATYAFAVIVVLIAALASGLVVRRRLDRLDLVAVLKAAE
jgi:putative ABC transport system permease protein